jgi:uncharacterized membrane protein YqaE (UPF0057 family)
VIISIFFFKNSKMGFINLVLSPLNSIFEPIVKIMKAVLQIIALLIELIKIVPKLFSLFTIFTDPGKVIKDTLYGLMTGFKLIFETILDSTIGGIHSTSKNYLGKLGDEEEHEEKKECFTSKILEILLLILCPPLAIFVRKGISSILLILIAFALTYMYYIPGLIFASLYVL